MTLELSAAKPMRQHPPPAVARAAKKLRVRAEQTLAPVDLVLFGTGSQQLLFCIGLHASCVTAERLAVYPRADFYPCYSILHVCTHETRLRHLAVARRGGSPRRELLRASVTLVRGWRQPRGSAWRVVWLHSF